MKCIVRWASCVDVTRLLTLNNTNYVASHNKADSINIFIKHFNCYQISTIDEKNRNLSQVESSPILISVPGSKQQDKIRKM